MQFQEISITASFSAAYTAATIDAAELNQFEVAVNTFLNDIDQTKEEEYIKNQTAALFKNTFYPDTAYHINIDKRKDLVIREGKKNTDNVAVILEFKSLKSSDMVTKGNFNTKALHELVWYYMQEREGNVFIKNLIITNGTEWFVFKAADFETIFYKDKAFMKAFTDFKNGLLSQGNTEHFYKEIAQTFIKKSDKVMPFVHFNLHEISISDKHKQAIFKILNPQHLLKQAFQNDSNSLNRPFYDELLHLLGLQEVKEGGIKRIQRKPEHDRDEASLLENTIKVLRTGSIFKNIDNLAAFGTSDAEQLESIALELCITWLNRVLFMKLLEGQLTRYHRTNTRENYAFMHYEQSGSSDGAVRFDFDQINQLFFEVMAVPQQEREGDAKNRFGHLPYLNSALFEMTQLEKSSVRISNLKDNLSMPLFPATVLKDARGQRESGGMPLLKYLLDFLNAYNFAAQGTAILQTDNKTLINASVLGLVFEKLNGYRDGSFFTPGFVTMYMCRETIRTAVVQKYNETFGWDASDLDDVVRALDRHKTNDADALRVLHSLRICDPAVGSGHFLVSALNELILIQTEIGLLNDADGKPFRGYTFTIENDEFLVRYKTEFFEYAPEDPESARMQAALFEAKRAFIENCLFGVDINPKSVAICQLRLWIELLKNAYYTPSVPQRGMTDGNSGRLPSSGGVGGGLQTLPNIDINIKTGNSLVHKVALDENLTHIFSQQKYSAATYLNAVTAYKQAKNKDEKEQFAHFLVELKNQIRTVVFNNNPLVKELSKLRGQLTLIQNKDALGDLFGKLNDQDFAQKATVLEKQIAALELKEHEYRTGAIYRNAFEWRFEFPEVLNENGDFIGFDAIVGNPPYIQLQSMPNTIVDFYKTKYDTFARTGDIFHLFYERAHQVLKQNGSMIFITNAFDKTTSGTLARQFLNDNFSFKKYIDLTSIVVFEEATTYPVILFANKDSSSSVFDFAKIDPTTFVTETPLHEQLMYHDFVQTKLNAANWQFGSDTVQSLLSKITQHKNIREQFGKCYYGIKTGLNEAFIIDGRIREGGATYPVYEGKDLKKWQSPTATKQMIIFPAKSTKKRFSKEITEDAAFAKLKERYPLTMQHLKPFREKALQRLDKGDFWWEMRNCAYYDLFQKPKILFPNLQNTNKFSLDNEGVYVNAPAVFLPNNDTYLLGVLNSKIVWYFLKSICVVRNGGYIEVKPQYFEQIPIPSATPEQQAPIIALVEQILAAKAAAGSNVGEVLNLSDSSAAAAVDTAALEAQIDALVYALYGLTAEEIAVVEG
jgi:adenine-specific DNA-methyltransferase